MKRRVNVKAVIEDIRSGVNDEELMTKYDLPPRGLQALFKRLLDFELVTHAELYNISALYRGKKIYRIKQRRNPRAELSVPLLVHDVGSSGFGLVRDISEDGLCLA